MKNVLILSCNTGQGHNSCAKAVEEYLNGHGAVCETRDALAFISEGFSRFISGGHNWVYRHAPGLFRWGYRYSEDHPAVFRETSLVYRLLTAGVERMYTYIAEGGYDTVITTHVFSALILTHMLKAHPMDIQTAFIGTDYTCSPSMEASDLQYYFIPAEKLKDEYAKCGIPRERMIASGIPVRHEFWKRVEKGDAKRLLGINVRHKHLLVMCGSMGCGPIPQMVCYIAKTCPADTEVSVICGTNRRLEKKLKRQCRKSENVHIVGYTNQMALYLDAADLYLTKPGGISVTEAAVKDCPMAFVDAVAGCESYNMNFFMEMGAAVTAAPPKKLAEESIRVMHSAEDMDCMERALLDYDQRNGSARVFQTLNGGIHV